MSRPTQRRQTKARLPSRPTPVTGQPGRVRAWAPALIVAGAAVITYLSALPNGFVSDAESLIPRNAALVNSTEWLGWFSRPYFWGSHVTGALLYRPLTILSYVATLRVAGAGAMAFVIGNVVLHAAASVLVWALGRRLLDPAAALLGALLFAVHPIHTEAVAWVGGRTDVLASVFVLISVLCLLRAMEDGGVRSTGYALAATGAYLAALLSKEHAITLPAWFVLAWLLGDRRRTARPVALALGGGLLALGLYFALRAWMVPSSVEGAAWIGARMRDHLWVPWRWLAGLAVAGTYARLFVWPSALTFDYTHVVATWVRSGRVEPLAALWGATVIAGFLVAFTWAIRRHRGLALVLGLIPVTYGIVSSFPVTPQVFIAERFTYLPSVGACLAAGWALCRVAERLAAGAWVAGSRPPGVPGASPGPPRQGRPPWPSRRWGVAAGVLAGLVLLLAARSAVRNLDWRSDASLARAAVSVAPDSPLALRALAQEAIKRGDDEAARTLLERSLRGDPRRTEPYALLAPIYFRRGDTDRVVELARQAARELPQRWQLLHSLGGLLWQVGRREDAERLFRQVVARQPAFFQSRLALGGLLLETGRAADALEEFRAASQLEPGNPTVWLGLARASQTLGRTDDARSYLERARAAQLQRPPEPPRAGTRAGQ